MTEVKVHIYDMTSKGFNKTNATIVQINKLLKDTVGLGGIFHCAVQVYGDDEWSFGACEQGTGVFSCPSQKNSMYTYRETIVLGKTDFSILKVNKIIKELSAEWPGTLYHPLSKNANHFCNAFCEWLGVPKPPDMVLGSRIVVPDTLIPETLSGWVNRFANAGDTAMDVAGSTALLLQETKADVVSASKGAYKFLSNVTSTVINGPNFLSNSNKGGGTPASQSSWLKNITTTKPSTGSEAEQTGKALVKRSK